MNLLQRIDLAVTAKLITKAQGVELLTDLLHAIKKHHPGGKDHDQKTHGTWSLRTISGETPPSTSPFRPKHKIPPPKRKKPGAGNARRRNSVQSLASANGAKEFSTATSGGLAGAGVRIIDPGGSAVGARIARQRAQRQVVRSPSTVGTLQAGPAIPLPPRLRAAAAAAQAQQQAQQAQLHQPTLQVSVTPSGGFKHVLAHHINATEFANGTPTQLQMDGGGVFPSGKMWVQTNTGTALGKWKPNSTMMIGSGGTARVEVAASEMDRIMGLGVVPLTVFRNGPEGVRSQFSSKDIVGPSGFLTNWAKGSIQQYCEAKDGSVGTLYDDNGNINPRAHAALLKLDPSCGLRVMALDLLLQNGDRHGKNFIVLDRGQKSYIAAIDNGLALENLGGTMAPAKHAGFLRYMQFERIPQKTFDMLRRSMDKLVKLTPAQRKKLPALSTLTDDQWRGLVQRAQACQILFKDFPTFKQHWQQGNFPGFTGLGILRRPH